MANNPTNPRKKKRSLRRSLLLWGMSLCVWGAVGAGVALAYFAHNLPDINNLEVPEKKHSIIIKSSDGVILGSFGDLYGDFLSYKQLPKPLVEALLATEDRRFFEHFGIDLQGLLRAAYHNYTAGHVVEGGSTITQQLAKNLFLSPERTLHRKMQEAILALELEHKFTKEQILTLYLNRVYLGAGTFGVDAAAKRYFQKPASQLNLMESAMIVGLLKAPSRFSPTNNPELARARAMQVIENMKEAGYLKDDKAVAAAKAVPATSTSYREGSMGSYYFADWIMEHLDEYIGHIDSDIEIITTLDSHLQGEAEESLEEAVKKDGPAGHFTQGALVALSPDGAIRAMVGGRDYRQSQFNRVTQAHRQPGSSFKLFDYLAALEHGANPTDMWVDQPITIGNWSPANYTEKYKGEMTLSDAFAQSINSIAVQVAMWAGIDSVAEMAQRLGINSPMLATPSLALGSDEVTMLELATAYDHLANQGLSVFPYGIEEIHTTTNQQLYKRVPSAHARVLSSSTVMAMDSMMMNVVQTGTGRAASLSGYQVAGKTGTSQDYRDAWFTGFTNRLLASVWVGNDDGTFMKKVTGGGIPTHIWKNFMLKAHKDPMPDFMKQAPSLEVESEQPLPWQSQEDVPPDAPTPSASQPQDNQGLPWQQQQPSPAPSVTPATPFSYPNNLPGSPPQQPGQPAVIPQTPPQAAPAPGASPRFEDIIHTPIATPPGQ